MLISWRFLPTPPGKIDDYLAVTHSDGEAVVMLCYGSNGAEVNPVSGVFPENDDLDELKDDVWAYNSEGYIPTRFLVKS